MIEELLAILPVLAKYIPILAEVIAAAAEGNSHGWEDALCHLIPGLSDVCAALRDSDGPALLAVQKVLGTSDADLHAAIAKLTPLAKDPK